MRPLILLAFLPLISVCAFAEDTITMEDGKIHKGHILYMAGSEIMMDIEGQEDPQRINLSQIKTIQYGQKPPIRMDQPQSSIQTQ